MLLHICCAPCATYSTERFRALGYNIYGFFYNPNIHPDWEYRRRLDTLRDYCRRVKIPLAVSTDYHAQEYLRQAPDNKESRCQSCYRLRLDRTAREAAKQGIPAFATTLAISPHQNQELLQMEGAEAGRRHGVLFVYLDLRPGYRQSVDESRRLGLYRQKYCGCLFSAGERSDKKPGGGYSDV